MKMGAGGVLIYYFAELNGKGQCFLPPNDTMNSFPTICFLFCCWWIPFMTAAISAKKSQAADDGINVGNVSFAQQSPRIKWTDEGRRQIVPSSLADDQQQQLLQSTQLFRSANNAQRFRSSMPSNEERTQDEVVRLRNVAKEVEEKLGLAPPGPNANRRQWQTPATVGASLKRGDLPPAIDSPGLFRRFIGPSENAGGPQRIRPQNALAASLLRQQRELAQSVQAGGIKPVGIGSNLIGQQQQFEREQQRQQQLQTLLQQLAAIQQQRQLQQLLLNSQRRSVAVAGGRNEQQRLGASSSSGGRTSSSTLRGTNNFEQNFAPPGFFGPVAGPIQTSPTLSQGKSLPTSSGIRRTGAPLAPATIYGGLQPDSKFVAQPPPIVPPSRGSPAALEPADFSALFQRLLLNNPANPSSSAATAVVDPIAAVLSPSPNGGAQVAVPKATQQERSSVPVVVRLVTAANEQQQQPQNANTNNNAIALQQILLQEQQRIVDLIGREQYREQLVQNNRKELQSVQEQQQRILELLDTLEREKEQQQLKRNSRGRNSRRESSAEGTNAGMGGIAMTALTTSASPIQQQSFADANFLKGLLQAFANVVTPQQQHITPSGNAATVSAASSSVPGQQQLQNIGQNNIGGTIWNPPQQQQLLAVQQPNSAVQYVAVYDPRVGQQQQWQQFNTATSFVAGGVRDGTVWTGGQQQQVEAVPQVQQQLVGALPQVQQQPQQQLVGAVPQTQQQLVGAVPQVQQQLVGAVPQTQQQLVGAVPQVQQQLVGWLPAAGDTLSGGLLWQQLQQQQQNENNNDQLQQQQQQLLLSNNDIVQRAQQRRQDVQRQQQNSDRTAAANGQQRTDEQQKVVDEDGEEEAQNEDDQTGGKALAAAAGDDNGAGGTLEDENDDE